MNNIINEILQEISFTTQRIFDEMIWKKNTFGKVSINGDYEVEVHNKNNVLMTASLSATEKMALAYAFTLAVHRASGKNCPLVIDSPLGRVSDENRGNMARSLLEISTITTKQLIMLFTPDEYSEEVKVVYDNKVNVQELKLSMDETHVEGV
jgi:DNA sulfur modification protein DndD